MDHRPWKRLGDLATTVFALGLHQEPDDNVPFFLKEIRKRIFVAAYSLDKQLATFLGRPPLISWRYCNIQFPLDLSYDEIVSDPATRDAAIARLESNNWWNIEGTPAKGGWARAILTTCIVREKVLELSLCHQDDDLAQKVECVNRELTFTIIADKGRAVSRESEQMRLALPDFLHWNPEHDSSLSAYDDNVLFQLHLDFLYSSFLLYRILDRRTQTQSDGLIKASRDILSGLIQMVAKINRAGKPPVDIGWDVSIVSAIHTISQLIWLLTNTIVMLLLSPCRWSPSDRIASSIATNC